MIDVAIEVKGIEEIMKALEGDVRTTKKALRKAINDTAKDAKKLIAHTANREYAGTKIKLGALNSAMSIQKATIDSLQATIKAKNPANDLSDFKVTKGGKKSGVKAKVLKSSSLKSLQVGDIKAFLITFGSGHTAVVQRVSGKRAHSRKAGRKRTITRHNMALKALYSVSTTTMLGGEHGYGKVQNEIHNKLQQHIDHEVMKALTEGGK